MKCLCQKSLLEEAIKQIATKKNPTLRKHLVFFTARVFQERMQFVENAVLKQLEEIPDTEFSVELLRSSRKNVLGIPQTKAAKLLGVSWVTFQSYEYGKFKMPLHRWKLWLDIIAKAGQRKRWANFQEQRGIALNVGLPKSSEKFFQMLGDIWSTKTLKQMEWT